MNSSTTIDPPRIRSADQPGIRFGIGHAALVAAVLLAGAVRLDLHLTLALLVLTVVAAGAGLRPGWTTALAVSAWALYTGFLEHGEGTLAFAPRDLDHLALLSAAGLLIGLAGHREARR